MVFHRGKQTAQRLYSGFRGIKTSSIPELFVGSITFPGQAFDNIHRLCLDSLILPRRKMRKKTCLIHTGNYIPYIV